MTPATDTLTVALTGQLPFILLLAAALAWPVSLGLLTLYRRAVLRSMRARANLPETEPAPSGTFRKMSWRSADFQLQSEEKQ